MVTLLPALRASTCESFGLLTTVGVLCPVATVCTQATLPGWHLRIEVSQIGALGVPQGEFYAFLGIRFLWLLYQSPGAAITKYHRLGSLNHRNFLSQESGGWKSEIMVSAGLLPPEGKLCFSLSPRLIEHGLHVHVAFFLCVYVCITISPFIRT